MIVLKAFYYNGKLLEIINAHDHFATLNDCGWSNVITSATIWRIKHAGAHIYCIDSSDGRCLEAGVCLLTGRFPCVFLTLGSFPCWHTPAAYRSPLWDDSNMYRTCPGRKTSFHNSCIDSTVICLCIFLVSKLLWSNLNGVIGEHNLERLCGVQCQIYAKKKDPCGLHWCFCGGLINKVI